MADPVQLLSSPEIKLNNSTVQNLSAKHWQIDLLLGSDRETVSDHCKVH